MLLVGFFLDTNCHCRSGNNALHQTVGKKLSVVSGSGDWCGCWDGTHCQQYEGVGVGNG